MMTRSRSWLLSLGLTLFGAVGCGGDEVEPDGAGGQGGSTDKPVPLCQKDSECDDGLYCTGKERCDDGQCRAGARVQCADDLECTLDRCDEATRACVHLAPDLDQDGHASAACVGENGIALGDDCDDDDPLRYPGNAEFCDPDFRDEDCDSSTLGFRDSDNDGYVDALCCNEQADGELDCGEDCDDFKANVNPESPEVCDFFDNNCNGETDEEVALKLYPDADHDGHGDADAKSVATCPGAVGYAASRDDCDDKDPEVFLGQFEICDGKDNNCDKDRLVDEVEEQAPWYEDLDGDTYGDPESTPIFSCYRIPDRVLSRNDCDDGDKKVNPNAAEICDAKDNDCNGLADFRLEGINNFEDDDGDLAADSDCGGDDCDDRDARTSGGAEEVCDHVDNDCDGLVDEQTTQNIWYIDEDGDGWGVVIGSALASCDPIASRASQFGDCDDTRNDVRPGITESCDGVDNDCDGQIDEGAAVHCQLPGAMAACQSGSCAIYTCHPGFADTDGNPENGCEDPVDPADYLTTIACSGNAECNDGNLCNGIETCSGGFCRLGPAISCVNGPNVVQGDVVIRDGRDLNSLRGIERITGSLLIESTSLNSLVGLESIRSIGGNLIIRLNTWLLRLSGSALSNLETVGGDIVVDGNERLVSVDLPSLLSASSISISNNVALENLSGYKKLLRTEGVIVTNNAALKKIDAFSKLAQIGGKGEPVCEDGCDYCLGLGLRLERNPELQSIIGFAELQAVGGDLCVEDLQSKELSFPKLERVDMALSIHPPLYNEEGNGSGDDRIAAARKVPSPLERISFPKLKYARTFIVDGGGGLWTKLKTMSFPLLAEVSDDVRVILDFPELSALELPLLQKAGYVEYTNYQALLKKTGFESLRAVNQLQFYLGGEEGIAFSQLKTASSISISLPYSGPIALKTIDFSALESTDYFWLIVDGQERSLPDLGAIRFPNAQSFGSFSLSIVGDTPALTTIRFDKLTEARSFDLRVLAPSALQEIRLSALETVDETLSIRVPFVPPQGSPGLTLSNLAVVGTQDQNNDELPDNTGSLALCTGVLEDQEGGYQGAACSFLEEFVEGGYRGTPDSCGQCTPIVDGDGGQGGI